MHSTQRTAPVTCRINASRVSAPRMSRRASALEATGKHGSLKVTNSSWLASRSCAGCISEQWNGALTDSIIVRFAPASLQRAAASSTAAAEPEITVCSGAFMFAGATTALTRDAASAGVVAELAGSLTASTAAAICSTGSPGFSGGFWVSSSETSAQMSLMRSASSPKIAAMAPSPGGVACCIY